MHCIHSITEVIASQTILYREKYLNRADYYEFALSQLGICQRGISYLKATKSSTISTTEASLLKVISDLDYLSKRKVNEEFRIYLTNIVADAFKHNRIVDSNHRLSYRERQLEKKENTYTESLKKYDQF